MQFITFPDAFNTYGKQVVFFIIGIVTIYAGIKNLLDKENPARIGTAIFWCAFGITCAFGDYLPSVVSGILVVIMCLPPIFKQVKPGKSQTKSKEYEKAQYQKIGMKIFAPALTVAACSLILALFTNMNSMIAVTLGVILAIIMLTAFSPKENTLDVYPKGAERYLSIMGPLCMLPQLLGSLGGVFTAAGVGDVIASLVSYIIPAGNVNIGIIVYAVGMALFTMIMGNAFAAITVLTVGVGGPFVLAYGANPALIGMLALTCGYCGTLCTPMAANFNIVPVAILDMKKRFGVIRNQVVPAIIMLTFQIIWMIIFK